MTVFSYRADFVILSAGFLLFLVTVVIPTHFSYYTYSSDARSTYENQGFQILDSLHVRSLPLWDPYNANGRDGTCLSVGMGAFAPDLLLASWLCDIVLPNISTVDKSFLVNLVFRYFLIFGLGIWFLGTLFLRTRTAVCLFWCLLVFGTPLIMPLNNQMLSQMLMYFPWVLFFLLKFAITGTYWSVLGLFLSLSTIFLAFGRDFPLLLYAVFITTCVVVIVFWPTISQIRPSSYSISQVIVVILALAALFFLILSLEDLGQQFLSLFAKKRYVVGGMDASLTTEFDVSMMNIGSFLPMGSLLPDILSLIFVLPTATVHFLHYHPGHSYMFLGLSGPILLLFSFSGPSRRVSYFFVLLAIIFSLSAYWRSFPLHILLREIIPGLKMYQYVFHLKYLTLICLGALAAIGLDNVISGRLNGNKKERILISIALLCLVCLVLPWIILVIAEHDKLPFILGSFFVVIGRCFQSYPLLKLVDGCDVRKWATILVACEMFFAVLSLSIGHKVLEAGWRPIRSYPMYFLNYRPNNFTLHTADPSGFPEHDQNLCIGTVYKCNFAKDEHLRMNGQARLYNMLGLQQREILLGAGSPRLFLAHKVRVCSEENLMDTLNGSVHPSIREVPVIVDNGHLPPGLPLLQPGETLPHTANSIKLVQVTIPRSLMNVEELRERDGWSKITVKGAGLSCHLSTNPYIVMQEHLSCYLNGTALVGNWLMEDLERSPFAAFELNKTGHDVLKVLAPIKPDKINSLVLEYRDTGGIHISDFGYNHLDIICEADGVRVLVYLDNYAEGWEATIDGNEAPIMCAYGAYKALLVPGGGRHKVSFRYRPEKIINNWESAYASYTLLIALFVCSFFIGKSYNPET